MERIESRGRAVAEEDQWPGKVVMCPSMQKYQPCLCSGCWANVHRMSHIESLLVEGLNKQNCSSRVLSGGMYLVLNQVASTSPPYPCG
jgi:hypothetical protein